MIFCFSKQKKSLFLKTKKQKKKSFSYKKDNSLIEISWIKIMKTLVGLDIVGPISNIIQVSCCNKVSFSFRHSKSYWKNVLIVSSNQNIISDYWQKREQQFIFSTYIKSKKKKKFRFRHTKSSWEKEATFHCSLADGNSYLKLIDDPRSK